MPRVVLGRELNRPAEIGTQDGGLQGTNDAVAKFERDIRPLVEAEQAAQLIAKAVLAEVLVEPVAQVEVRTAGRKPQRGRKIDQNEVWFGRIEDLVIVRRLLGVSRRNREKDPEEEEQAEAGAGPSVSMHATRLSKPAAVRKRLKSHAGSV